MGAVTFSLDPNLIQVLQETLPLDVFVETGTFKGDTVEIVKDHFKQIYSIELSKEYYEQVKARFQNMHHLTLIQGDSGSSLKSIMPEIKDRPTLFWLDAHWCVAENTAGEMSQCPLLAELDAIQQLNPMSMIAIDDARLFLTTPPAPHEASDWPSFTNVVHHLFKLSNQHRLMILNDCILFFPEVIQANLEHHAYQKGIDWLTVLDKSRDYDKLLTQLIEKEKQIFEKEEQIQLLARVRQELEKTLHQYEKDHRIASSIFKCQKKLLDFFFKKEKC